MDEKSRNSKHTLHNRFLNDSCKIYLVFRFVLKFSISQSFHINSIPIIISSVLLYFCFVTSRYFILYYFLEIVNVYEIIQFIEFYNRTNIYH